MSKETKVVGKTQEQEKDIILYNEGEVMTVSPADLILPEIDFKEVVQTMYNQMVGADELERQMAATAGTKPDEQPFVYHFPMKGQEVWGLTYKGVDMICALLAQKNFIIRAVGEPHTIEETEDYVTVSQHARLYKVINWKENSKGDLKPVEVELNSTVAGRRQEKWKTKADGDISYINNPWENAQVKSLKKAFCHFIPVALQKAMIRMAKSLGKYKTVENGEEDESKNGKTSFSKVFATAKEIYPNLTPGQRDTLIKNYAYKKFDVNSLILLNATQADELIEDIRAEKPSEGQKGGKLF